MIVSIEPRTPKAVGEVANGLTRTAKDNLVAEIDEENDMCSEEVPESMGGLKEIAPTILSGIDRGMSNQGMPFVIEVADETDSNKGKDSLTMIVDGKEVRIRKLTPKECWRLMDFDDADFEKAEAVNSNTQLYKQAGNSIVVAVLEQIIKEML